MSIWAPGADQESGTKKKHDSGGAADSAETRGAGEWATFPSSSSLPKPSARWQITLISFVRRLYVSFVFSVFYCCLQITLISLCTGHPWHKVWRRLRSEEANVQAQTAPEHLAAACFFSERDTNFGHLAVACFGIDGRLKTIMWCDICWQLSNQVTVVWYTFIQMQSPDEKNDWRQPHHVIDSTFRID